MHFQGVRPTRVSSFHLRPPAPTQVSSDHMSGRSPQQLRANFLRCPSSRRQPSAAPCSPWHGPRQGRVAKPVDLHRPGASPVARLCLGAIGLSQRLTHTPFIRLRAAARRRTSPSEFYVAARPRAAQRIAAGSTPNNGHGTTLDNVISRYLTCRRPSVVSSDSHSGFLHRPDRAW